MRRSFLVGLVPVLAFAAVSLTSTKEAHAGPIIGLDLDLGTAFQNQVDFSVGGGLRLGYRFGLPGTILYLQPELGGHYMRFGFNSQSAGYDYAGIVNGGLKFGLSGIVQPNIFGHLGLGVMGYNDCAGNVCSNGSTTGLGPAGDIGAGLDFRVVPGFLLGMQVAYNTVTVPTGFNGTDVASAKWVNFGLNATFHIGEPRPRPVYVQPVYYRRY
jgi:hypothetical protein